VDVIQEKAKKDKELEVWQEDLESQPNYIRTSSRKAIPRATFNIVGELLETL